VPVGTAIESQPAGHRNPPLAGVRVFCSGQPGDAVAEFLMGSAAVARAIASARHTRGTGCFDHPACGLVLPFTPGYGVARLRVWWPRSTALWIDVANTSR